MLVIQDIYIKLVCKLKIGFNRIDNFLSELFALMDMLIIICIVNHNLKFFDRTSFDIF